MIEKLVIFLSPREGSKTNYAQQEVLCQRHRPRRWTSNSDCGIPYPGPLNTLNCLGENLQPITDPSALDQETQRQLSILEFGTVEITPYKEFVAMLRHSLSTGTPLRVKCGIDPTSTEVHMGHLVPYRRMRAFQDLGHTGVVIIGDYTARIGDPTGKNESRPPLAEEQVKKNYEFYREQLLTLLLPSQTESYYQSEWLEKATLQELISWSGQTTMAKLLSHDTFKQRIHKGLSLGLHEMFYPVLQGRDSVEVRADVELGGSDQRFNVLMGRDYQKNVGQRPQCAMLLPLVTGLDGKQKMSSSLNNYIGLRDGPFDMFGKIMSVPDKLILEYFKYLANATQEECGQIEQGLESGELHPNQTKKQLAARVVSLFHGEKTAQQMHQQFERVFAQKKIPDEISEYTYRRGETLIELLVNSRLLSSKGEAKRMVEQGGVSLVQGERLSQGQQVLGPTFANKILKVGKRRFLKLR